MSHITIKAIDLKVGDKVDNGTIRTVTEIRTSQEKCGTAVHYATTNAYGLDYAGSFDHARADSPLFVHRD
jgi:hypothetical protein